MFFCGMRRSTCVREARHLGLLLPQTMTERCGQLVLYPDTGDPPVVVEPNDDVDRRAQI
jgi:hypothetical protein